MYIYNELHRIIEYNFQPTVDLLALTVDYVIDNKIVMYGLLDISITTEKFYSPGFNLYYKSLLPRVIKPELIDNYVELYDNKSSYRYLLLDTVNMIRKVELLNEPNYFTSIHDIYKYIKYLRKFYHLLLLHNDSQNYIKQLGLFLEKINSSEFPDPFTYYENYKSQIIVFHKAIKQADITSEVYALNNALGWLPPIPVQPITGGRNTNYLEFTIPPLVPKTQVKKQQVQKTPFKRLKILQPRSVFRVFKNNLILPEKLYDEPDWEIDSINKGITNSELVKYKLTIRNKIQEQWGLFKLDIKKMLNFKDKDFLKLIPETHDLKLFDTPPTPKGGRRKKLNKNIKS
jgi:hypothetical protein